MERYLTEMIMDDLKKKMVFVGGPRQVGKRKLSLDILSRHLGVTANEDHPAYMNWDDVNDRDRLLEGRLPSNQSLIVLDEIHKYPGWRNLIKGLYDKNKSTRMFLVTGSARLDYYRRGGDSLQGRYHYYRLHPLSLVELGPKLHTNMDQLLEFGGFPEPFFASSIQEWKRWQRERNSRVYRDDLVTLEHVSEVSKIEHLGALLRKRVGSVLSINSIREELSCSHETAERWVSILENLYVCYRIPPYGTDSIKAIKKEKKLYLWDWSLVESKGHRLENLVASNLLKFCHFLEDTQGDDYELRFLRDREKREVDFVVMKNAKPLFAVEVKSGDQSLSAHIPYFAARLPIPVFYQVHLGSRDEEYTNYRTRILPLQTFCKEILNI